MAKRKTKKVMPGGKGTTEKKRRWKVDPKELDDMIAFKAKREAEITELKTDGESHLNLLVEDMKETARDLQTDEPIPDDMRGRVILSGRYFVER